MCRQKYSDINTSCFLFPEGAFFYYYELQGTASVINTQQSMNKNKKLQNKYEKHSETNVAFMLISKQQLVCLRNVRHKGLCVACADKNRLNAHIQPQLTDHAITHITWEKGIKNAAVLLYTISHLKQLVITAFSFQFSPIKLPLTLQLMQNTDKCKMSPSSVRQEFQFHKITISVCSLPLHLVLIFHLQYFISSFSPCWPCKSQINFHLKCLTTDCSWKLLDCGSAILQTFSKSFGN